MKIKKSILHDYFVALGKKGGSVSSPAKTAAAILANRARWKNHVKINVEKKNRNKKGREKTEYEQKKTT